MIPDEPVSIGSTRTPQLGEVWVALSPRGLIAVEFAVTRHTFEASVNSQFGYPVRLVLAQRSASVVEATCQIAEYLAARRRVFEMPIDWSILASDFQRTALHAVMAIPYGETRTYAQVAAEVGYPQAPRAVGRANATNPMPLVIPCHRVVGSDGKLHGYGGAGGLKTKRWLLDMECGIVNGLPLHLRRA